MRLLLACLLTVTVAIAAPPRQGSLRRFERVDAAMGTTVRIVLYAPGATEARKAAEAAFRRIHELDGILSDYDPRSELNRLCREASAEKGVPVGEDLWRVLARAAEISRASGGAFDATVGPVVRLWRQARREGRLPDRESLEKGRALVDHRLVRLDPERHAVQLLRHGMRLDLGGIAKGYAAGEALEVLARLGFPRALVDIGGDIALGSPPPGAAGWTIGVASHAEAEPVEHLQLSRVAVATSGDAEQHLAAGGKRYSHIIDPRTGKGLTDHSGVTIVAPDCATADALASAVSVLGPGEGLDLIERTPGTAGRIVRLAGRGRQVYTSLRWKNLARVGPIAQPQDDAPKGKDGKEAKPGKKPADPTVTPPVAWLPDAMPLPQAEAKSDSEMKPYTERIAGSGVTFDMVPVHGGKFIMGSPSSEARRGADEGPQIEVEVAPFWMGKCEVTWDEYDLWATGYDAHRKKDERETVRDRLADAITRPTKPYSDMTFGMGRDGYPAVCMTQLAAKVYCKWLSAKTGRYYRLPTEAEWEYAARAGTRTAYSFGDDPKALGEYAWYYDNSSDKYHPVGRKKPNPWGLFDMHGNAAEWTLNAYTPDGYRRYAGKLQHNPLVVPESLYPRVVRGGSWNDDPEMLRSAARRASDESWKMGDPQLPQSIWYHTDAAFVGFRVVRPLKPPPAGEAARYDLDAAQKETFADYMEYLAGRQ